MATRQLAELCEVILAVNYGELAARVMTLLFDHGRLPLSEIVRRAQLPNRSTARATITRTLVALVQNRYVLYWEDKDLERNLVVVYYTPNWPAVYAFVWNGPIIALVEDAYPDELGVAQAVKNVITYGHIRGQDYIASSGVDPESSAAAESMLTRLVASRVLLPVLDWELHPDLDLTQSLYEKHFRRLASAEARAYAASSMAKAKSDQANRTEASEAAARERAALQEQKDQPNLGLVTIKAEDFMGPAKTTLDLDAALAVNHDRFLVTARSEYLVGLVSRRVGKISGLVYKALLSCYDGKLNRCRTEMVSGDKFNITTREIVRALDPGVVLDGTIVDSVSGISKRKPDLATKTNNDTNGAFTKRLKLDLSTFAPGPGTEEPDEADLQTQLRLANAHLQLVANTPIRFVVEAGNRGGGEWFVPFDEVMDEVRRLALEDLVENRLSRLAARLLRIIRTQGRVDEKQLALLAMVRVEDTRLILTEMHKLGVLDVQEIPKTNDRAASRTIFLWYHDPARSYNNVLQDMYTAMARLYKRLGYERDKYAILLAKLEREDVRGHEDIYLTASEKTDVRQLRRIEEKLAVQILRIDSLVRVLRDY